MTRKEEHRLDPTLLALWFHVPFVTAWVGLVLVDLLVLLVPGLAADQRARIVAWSRPFTLLAILVIMATGIWQTIYNPIREVTSYTALSELRNTTVYGHSLFWKHGFVVLTFALTLAARFWLAPRLLRLHELGGSASQGTERTLFWVASLNLAACLGALVLATRMIWALH
jgi:putative copper export protein